MPTGPPFPLCSQVVLDFSLILFAVEYSFSHTALSPFFVSLRPSSLDFFFLFIVNTNSSSSSGCTVCVGLMYLLICSHSSLLLDLFFNCKEQDSSVMYLNWMLTAAGENVSPYSLTKKKKKIKTLLLLLSMEVGI